jgi:hypothetical protein
VSIAQAFWLFSVLALAALAATAAGYATLPVAVTLLLISMVLLKVATDSGKGVGDLKTEITGRIASVENSLSGLTSRFDEIRSNNELTLGAMDRVKSDVQGEMKMGLDRMAERLIDFENGMNQMKRTFSAAVASLDDRMRAVEPKLGMDGTGLGPGIAQVEPSIETEEYIELDRPGAQ